MPDPTNDVAQQQSPQQTEPGVLSRIYTGAKNLATTGDITGHPEVTARNFEAAEKQNDEQVAGEKEYSDWLYRTSPDEYKKANPVDFYLRKAHDFLSDAVVEPSLRGMSVASRAKFEPQIRQVANAGLGAYGVPSGGAGVGTTKPVRVTAGIVPPGEAGLVEGLAEEDIAAAGGHTIQGAGEPTPITVRPDSFIKKISAPESRVSSQVVKHYRDAIRAGEPLPPAELHLDENGNVIGADGRHRALAAVQEGLTEFPVRVTRRPPQLAHERVLPATQSFDVKVADSVRRTGGASIDPRNGKAAVAGEHMTEVYPEGRIDLGHPATAEDVRNFYTLHKDLFDKNPQLRIGAFENELNVSAAAPKQSYAEYVGKKLDQRSIYNVAEGREIPTGGQNLEREFPNYPLEQRLADLRGGSNPDAAHELRFAVSKIPGAVTHGYFPQQVTKKKN